MSMAFSQNRLAFALKIEKPLSSQAVYVAWQQSHAYILHILPTSSSCGLLRATLLGTEVIMIMLYFLQSFFAFFLYCC